MSKQLTPKQYIQTRARTLPVYKCFVNKDWESAHMAQVMVMRNHVNGNVTTGIYLVDLLCLGVKDATYFFNEPEAEITERLGDEFTEMFMQVDYSLAHNIVYAGHDFAMEFDIKPHADFDVAKFILEEDDDNVELLEIETGHEGKPHLVVRQAGQNTDALAKLRKNAGEGNYFYTIGDGFDDEADGEDEDEGYEEDDFEEGYNEESSVNDAADDAEDYTARTLEEIEVGTLTVLNARFIDDEDIFNEHEVGERTEDEKLTINLEAGIRALKVARFGLFDNFEKIDEVTAGFAEEENYIEGLTEEQQEEFLAAGDELEAAFESAKGKELDDIDVVRNTQLAALEKYGSNPLVASFIFGNSIFDDDTLVNDKAKTLLLARAPEWITAQLSLALGALIKADEIELYHSIYNSSDIADAFPGKDSFGSFDVNAYCLIQTLVSIRDNDLASAVYYYYLSSETEVFNSFLLPVQAELLNAIGMELGFDKGEDDEKPTLRIV